MTTLPIKGYEHIRYGVLKALLENEKIRFYLADALSGVMAMVEKEEEAIGNPGSLYTWDDILKMAIEEVLKFSS
jgi:hypothetical protein